MHGRWFLPRFPSLLRDGAGLHEAAEGRRRRGQALLEREGVRDGYEAHAARHRQEHRGVGFYRCLQYICYRIFEFRGPVGP